MAVDLTNLRPRETKILRLHCEAQISNFTEHDFEVDCLPVSPRARSMHPGGDVVEDDERTTDRRTPWADLAENEPNLTLGLCP